MVVTAAFINHIVLLLTKYEGDSQAWLMDFLQDPLSVTLAAWPLPPLKVVQWIMGFAAVQLVFMRLPGRQFHGPTAADGFRPVYYDNGPIAFVLTMACCAAVHAFDIVKLDEVYDNLQEIIVFMNVFALGFCMMLYVKGRLSPSAGPAGPVGNVVMDFYWGRELYPRLWGWDFKVFTNCRMGMMLWAVLCVCYAVKGSRLAVAAGVAVAPTTALEAVASVPAPLLTSVALQLIYIAKFFFWEDGYMSSMDIAHDRAGYYLCWGCLVWVPGLYTSAANFWVKRSVAGLEGVEDWHYWAVFALGVFAIWLNYETDRQRQHCRAVDGKGSMWGTEMRILRAKYTTADGEERLSVLLRSHLWGISRHFHYVPELTAALCWSVPLQASFAASYFYFAFLFILLMDRAVRDDARCEAKYGRYWSDPDTGYRHYVPYMVLPYIF